MKQVFQDLSSGTTLIRELPTPRCKAGQLLIRTQR
jgi:hypothetical protein